MGSNVPCPCTHNILTHFLKDTDIEISQEPEAKQVLRICGGEQQVHLACQAQSKSGSQLKYEWQKIDHKGQ